MKIWRSQHVYVAGHPLNIKAGLPDHWRGFFPKTGGEITFCTMQILGNLDLENCALGTDPKIPEGGLAAWISYFGDSMLDEQGFLTIRTHPLSNMQQREKDVLLSAKNIWIHLAVSKQRLRSGDARHWRCYLENNPMEIPLRYCTVEGLATQKNHRAESSPIEDERHMIAWVRHFGNFFLYFDDTAKIELLNPEKKQQNPDTV